MFLSPSWVCSKSNRVESQIMYKLSGARKLKCLINSKQDNQNLIWLPTSERRILVLNWEWIIVLLDSVISPGFQMEARICILYYKIHSKDIDFANLVIELFELSLSFLSILLGTSFYLLTYIVKITVDSIWSCFLQSFI